MNNTEQYQNLKNYTDMRIAQWYENVAEEYGVIGTGETSFTNDSVIVKYTEDGVSHEWSMAFYPEYFKEYPIEWVFNCWAALC